MTTSCILELYLIENCLFFCIIFAHWIIDGGAIDVVLTFGVNDVDDCSDGASDDCEGQWLMSNGKECSCNFSAREITLASHDHGLSSSAISMTSCRSNLSNVLGLSVFNRFLCKCNICNEPVIRSNALAVIAAISQSTNFSVCTTDSAVKLLSDKIPFWIVAHSKLNILSTGNCTPSNKSFTFTVLRSFEIILNLNKYFAIWCMNRSSMRASDAFRNISSDNFSIPVNPPLSNEKFVTFSNFNVFNALNAISLNAFLSIAVNVQWRNVIELIGNWPPNHFSEIFSWANVTFSIVKNSKSPDSTLHVYRGNEGRKIIQNTNEENIAKMDGKNTFSNIRSVTVPILSTLQQTILQLPSREQPSFISEKLLQCKLN